MAPNLYQQADSKAQLTNSACKLQNLVKGQHRGNSLGELRIMMEVLYWTDKL